jgi:hypothetical protein
LVRRRRLHGNLQHFGYLGKTRPGATAGRGGQNIPRPPQSGVDRAGRKFLRRTEQVARERAERIWMWMWIRKPPLQRGEPVPR